MSSKLGLNLAKYYSINFDIPKRSKKKIVFIIIHYTGMKKEIDAIKKLCNPNSKVSSHYLIKNNGEVLNLVPDLYTAWHAGVSGWKNYRSLNKSSIGIEINNAGHNFKYNKFTSKQINSLIILCNFLIKKFSIKKSFILGHSDIAPDRKKDPGEKFPWKYLSKKKVGLWHDLNEEKLLKIREKKVDKYDEINFIKNLYKIGYSRVLNKGKNKNNKLLTSAFQRRFRQDLVNGIIDEECLLISKNLTKNLK